MFTKRYRIFDLLGFPIYLDLSWFAIVILISWSLATSVFPGQVPGLSRATYWSMGVAGAMGLFASILAHELGHAVVARRFDLHIRSITLFIFGGVAEMTDEPPNAKSEFYVAIAGPIVSVFIAAGCFLLFTAGGQLMPASITNVIWYLGMINSVIVAFNLVPAFPLDGGRVLRSILWHYKGNLRWATQIASSLGSGFGMVLIILGLMNLLAGNVLGAIWQFLIGMFVRNASQMSYQHVLIRRALEGEPVSRFMRHQVVTVDPSLTVKELVENYIYRFHYKMFPVVESGQLVGCITTRDVQNVPRDEWSTTAVAHVSQTCGNNNTLAPTSDAMEAISKMNQVGASRLLVVDGERLVGLLSLSDLKNFIALKVELEGDSGNNHDSLPRRGHTDPSNGSSKTMRDESDQPAAEARLL